MLMAHKPWLRCMFCKTVIVSLKWVGIRSCASSRRAGTKNGNVCVVSETGYYQPPSPSSSTHSEMNPTSPTQTDKHYIHYFSFFFMWFDLCDPFLGVQYCWNDILEDLLSSSNRYVRWSLKRAKCTVCISSNLLRGNLAFTRHTQVVGKDI